MPNPARRAVALAALAAAIVAAAVALDLPSAAAQSDEQSGRIVAQRLADGRTEFGWQPAGGERVLPRARYFPAEVGHQRWLNSSPVEVGGVELGRINARRLSDGRIEFAFTPTDGERILPPSRYFPVGARVGRWLRSTEIAISAAPAAAGFVAVSAGTYSLDLGGHTCAIRAGNGAIECWGANYNPVFGDHYGQIDAPAGSFTAVATGAVYTCAIRENDSAIQCWGRLEALPPAGRFSAVAAGRFHTCGVRKNGRIECWDRSSTDIHAGSFTAVSAGGTHTCGLRENSAIECWGWNGERLTNTPAGSFSAVSAGGVAENPMVSFISEPAAHTCGLRTNGAITCWGDNEQGQTDAPAGSFTAVSAGGAHTCGLRTNGAITCWGDNEQGQTDAPAGSFTAVSAGGAHTCGLRTNGAITCWGNNEFGQKDAPAGSFTAVSAGSWHTCAIRESGAITCWGNGQYGKTDVPTP